MNGYECVKFFARQSLCRGMLLSAREIREELANQEKDHEKSDSFLARAAHELGQDGGFGCFQYLDIATSRAGCVSSLPVFLSLPSGPTVCSVGLHAAQIHGLCWTGN